MQNPFKIYTFIVIVIVQCSIMCCKTTTFECLIGPNSYLHANEQRNIFLFLLKTKTHFIAKPMIFVNRRANGFNWTVRPVRFVI